MTPVHFLSAMVALFLAIPLFAAPIEETVVRYLTLAHEGKFDDLPKTATGEGTDRFENRLRSVLRVRCLRVDGIAVQRISEDAAEVEIAVSKQNRVTRGPWSAPEVTPLRLRLARDGETWLVSAVEFLDEEFADRLIAAGDEERRTLFAENERRITGGLAMAVYQRAMALINSPTADKAPPVGALARDIAVRAGDRQAEAAAIGIAVIHSRIHRRFATGIALGREAIAIAEETGDPDALARAWNNISRLIAGDNHERKDFSEQSDAEEEETLRLALLYARQAEDATLLVRVLENLALRASARGDYYTARGHQEELLPIVREIGDRIGEIGYEIQVANLYAYQDDTELSRFHHRKAMELTRKYDPRRHPYTLIRYAGMLVQDERYAEARELIARAVQRDEKGAVKLVTNSLSANMAAFALRLLAGIAAEEGRIEDAVCLVAEAQALLPRHDLRNFAYMLSPYFEKRGDHRRALRYALQTAASGDMQSTVYMQSMIFAARAYRALGDPSRALALTREAVDVLEEQDLRLSGGEEQRIRLADLIASAYELAAELALERGEVVDALAFLESGRGRVLAEVIENGRPGAAVAAEQTDEKRRVAYEENLARLNVELARAVAAGNRTDAAKLEQQLFDGRHAYQSFVDGLRARSERRRATRRRFAPSDVRELLGGLPEGMAAIEYFVDGRQLHLFVARKNGNLMHRAIAVEREALRERVNEFVKAISTNDLRARAAAERLYRLLIAPIENELHEGETLLIVPNDVLWRVSFAALADARGRFVIESWPLVYAPSIAVFNEMAERRMRSPEPVTLLAIGNPDVDAAASSGYAAYYRTGALGPLPHAEIEVDAVRRLYGPRHCRVLKRHEATESRTKSEMARADMVHFATHGLLDDRNPMYSRLALARGGEPAEDGWLETWEIARLDMKADLVVLSACETARGQIGDGEWVVGMAWSFFVAGARSTLATQWKVESEHTARVMIRFHEALKSDLDKARALREAQLRSIRDPRHRHPFYWAAFVLFGSDS
jgi:CHAT domain-containing protein/tetratricopeptide (TPR) repeat protein